MISALFVDYPPTLPRAASFTSITFVVVTQDQEEVMTLSSRIAVMDSGRIEQIGTPNTVCKGLANRFVAGFIGSITFLDGGINRLAGVEATVALAGLAQEVTVAPAAGLAPGGNITLALRPHRFTINRDRPGQPKARHGTVEGIACFLKDSLSRVRLADGCVAQVSAVNSCRSGEGDRVADWDDQVWLGFTPEAAILLPG